MDSNTPGVYQITYSKTDAAGNTAEPVVRTINVVDSDAPIITLLGDSNITHEAGPEYVDAGARWNDSVDGNGTADANGTVNHLVPGIYQITYSFTDSSGNAAQQIVRTINVVDTTPPVINLIGDSNITIEAGLSFNDQGAIWTDIVDGNGTADANGSVNDKVPGIYQVVYTAVDSSGNAAEAKIRSVYVTNEPPSDINASEGLEFFENLSIGSYVASMVAHDPDIISSIAYSLFDSNDSLDNALFNIDENGTLTTASAFDFETDPKKYSIRVKATDEHNASLTRIFELTLLDVYENRPPEEIVISKNTVSENQPAGYEAAIFTGFDPDENDTLSFILVHQNSYFPDDTSNELNGTHAETDPQGDYNSTSLDSQLNEYENNESSMVEESNSSELNSALFYLEANGTLRTTRTFDFETDPTLTNLIVRVQDQDGYSTEANFTIVITNVIEDIDGDGIEDAYDNDRDGDGFENWLEIQSGTDPNDQYSTIHKPILETNSGMVDENGTFILSGKVSFNGYGDVEDFGFILSSTISLDGNNVHWIRGQGSPDDFELRFEESPYTPTLYFRAWAKNPAGYGIGPVKKLKIPEPNQSWWGEVIAMPGGWLESPWFGLFIYYEQGWLYHSQLGWLYSSPDQQDGIWLWNEAQGWLWTKDGVWPYLFKNDSSDWLYFTTSNQQLPIFYDYSTSNYIGLDEESNVEDTVIPSTAESGSAQ